MLLVIVLIFMQFRGDFTSKVRLTMICDRAGLVMDPGSKVAYNGVEIGRVASVSAVNSGNITRAKLLLDVDPQYVDLIPANVIAEIKATTVFGTKYVSLRSPLHPTTARVSSSQVIDASHVTTEFDTLFETLTSISQKADPVKINLTLSSAADALSGLGTKFGRAIINGDATLDDINPQMPQIRYDLRRLGDLADLYSKASPHFWDSLGNAITTAHTLNQQQGELDAALLAAAGFGDTAGDVLDRGSAYFLRGQRDLFTTTRTLDTYSPSIYCIVHNSATVVPAAAEAAGGNGYSIDFHIGLTGAPNPYIYPDNLPRVNGRGGPGGAPGCWQPITRDLWPAPYLVADTGASLAPYNHLEVGQPMLAEYVWGRQNGENTINP